MTLQEYRIAYNRQNPNDRVDEPKTVKTQWGTLLPYFVGLIAANILSAAHTGPMLASTFGKQLDPTLGLFLGFTGVLAVEFTAFILMLIPFSDNKRENVLRGIVILLALGVSLIANVDATVNSLQSSDPASQIAAGVVGVFAPLANIAMAEVLRLFRHRAKQEKELAEIDYKAELRMADAKMVSRYTRYLKTNGITDTTIVMKLSNGEDVPELTLPQSTTRQLEVHDRPEPTEKKTKNYPPRIITLANELVSNNDTGLSYKAMQEKYRIYPSDVSKVKQYLNERPN